MSLWLVRIRMDRRHHTVRRDLADAVALHKRVMSMFPDSLGDDARHRAGVLFRLDETQHGPCLLVQACIEPDQAKLPTDYGTVEVRKLGPLLDALTAGLPVHYRIAANATKRLAHSGARHRAGQVVALNGAEAEDWWARRSQQAGLTPLTIHSQPLPTIRGIRSNGQRVHHTATRFDGIATIDDTEAVRHAITDGIGKGKPYGCGLLSLAPTQPAP